MCGRYFIQEENIEEIRAIINEINRKFNGSPEIQAMKTGEVFPTNTVAVIGADGPTLMKWGIPMQGKSQTLINAKAETAAEKPMFRHALTARRVAVPTCGFFEWTHKGGKAQDKYLFRNPNEKVLYLAGLFSQVPLPSGMERRFVILTTAANEGMQPFHDRMPLYLAKEECEAWVRDARCAGEILRRAQPELKAVRVDSRNEKARVEQVGWF